MDLLVCAATAFEIEPALTALRTKGVALRVLITGVGLTETVYALTKAVTLQKPDLMIQAGIGGAISPNLALGTVVAIEKESIGDLGVEEAGGFLPVRHMGFVKQGHPWKGQFLVNSGDLLRNAGLKIADAVSVNEISTLPGRIEYYRSKLHASVESMEGAAFHYVALMENISFLQMRALSNFVGERNKQKWEMAKAISNLNRELERIIQNCLTA